MDTAADFGPEIVKAIFSQDEAAKVKLQIKQEKNSVAFISNCLAECNLNNTAPSIGTFAG